MWYIVYREKFKSYTETGGGYYIGYKNKLEDAFSSNWFEAKKYKSLGAAVNRLGIILDPRVDTMERFCEFNHVDHKAMERDNALSDVLGMEKSVGFLLKTGRIDKISDTGEFLGSADGELFECIKIQISKNKSSNDKKKERYNKAVNDVNGKSNAYITETKDGEDFWEGFQH